MFPSLPKDGDRDASWGEDNTRDVARSMPRAAAGVYGAVPDEPVTPENPDEEGPELDEEAPVVPVRRALSVAIAGFAGLLGVALLLGSQTAAPDSRGPYAFVILGVQLLYVLAWTMAMRPPVPAVVAGVGVASAALVDYLAVTGDEPSVLPFFWVFVIGVVAVVGGQFAFRIDRLQVRDAITSTVLILGGVVVPALLILLTRKPGGTQAVTVCLTAAAVALVIARLVDAVFPRPRIAQQVPRGATGIIVGAMVGTLVAAEMGSFMVLPFTPAKGAVLGLVAAGVAVLVDLAINFTEAGRAWPDEAPTFWLARHMQGPLGAFAAVAPAAYLLNAILLG